MSTLLWIWWVTIFLAALSLLAMSGLILQRFQRNRQSRRDEARRAELQELALTLIEHPRRLFEAEGDLTRSDRRLLLQVYHQLLPMIRGDYAERLVGVMRMLGVVDECVRQLSHASWWTRSQACRTLGAFRDPNVILALYRAIEDPVMAVRVEAARALARLGAVRSVVELMGQLVAGDELPSVPVLDLFRSLGQSGVPELMEVLGSDTGMAAKITAADALGHIGDLRAVPALLQLYDNASQILRLTAMQSLGQLGDPRALPAVLLAMTDPGWEVRAQAASAAGRIGSPDAIALLQQLLEDDHWWVRYYSAEALFRIGSDGVAALRSVAAGEHPSAAQMASGLLQEKGVAA